MASEFKVVISRIIIGTRVGSGLLKMEQVVKIDKVKQGEAYKL